MMTIESMERFLTDNGFETKKISDRKAQTVFGTAKRGDYEFLVRIEFSGKPVAVMTGKNGCTMKYITGDLDSLAKAILALHGGAKFCDLWKEMRN
jgi:hypothetical protein